MHRVHLCVSCILCSENCLKQRLSCCDSVMIPETIRPFKSSTNAQLERNINFFVETARGRQNRRIRIVVFCICIIFRFTRCAILNFRFFIVPQTIPDSLPYFNSTAAPIKSPAACIEQSHILNYYLFVLLPYTCIMNRVNSEFRARGYTLLKF